MNTLATMLCLTSHNYKVEKEGRDSDKAPLATSTTTVESESKEISVVLYLKKKYNQILTQVGFKVI